MSEGARADFRRQQRRRLLLLLAALLLLAVLLAADLALGAAGLPLETTLRALAVGWWGSLDGDRGPVEILWQIRMPPSLMALLVGMALGLAGLQMQTILANPLASPFTLGFSAAAGFGASLALMFGGALPLGGYLLTPLSAFLMTLVACGLIYLIARHKSASPEVLVLGGIAVLFFFQSVQSLLQYLAAPEVLQQIVFWLFGDLQKANWTSVLVLLLIIMACAPWIARDCWALTTLRLGDQNAASLGLQVEALRRRSFILVALLTAGAVAFVGTIGFVGLIAPHGARALVGEDHRFALPLAGLLGGVLLLGASVGAKLILPSAQLPVGIITAVAGVPMLFAIIFGHREESC